MDKGLIQKIKSDNALMGSTHSLSSVALYLIVIAFYPALIYKMLGTDSLYVLAASVFVLYGAARLPDWDNTQSSVISSLGIIGRLLSKGVRALSVVIYQITKTKYDNTEVNPHRKFFHTIVSAILMFLLVGATTKIPTEFELFGNMYTVGTVFVVFWVFLCTQIAFAGLLDKFFKKNKQKGFLGDIINIVISLIISIFLIAMGLQQVDSFDWIAFAIGFGYLAHILGDALTVAGVPLLFPFKIKGKRWYDIRILKIKAGGEIEKFILTPVFGIIIIFALVKIIMVL